MKFINLSLSSLPTFCRLNYQRAFDYQLWFLFLTNVYIIYYSNLSNFIIDYPLLIISLTKILYQLLYEFISKSLFHCIIQVNCKTSNKIYDLTNLTNSSKYMSIYGIMQHSIYMLPSLSMSLSNASFCWKKMPICNSLLTPCPILSLILTEL